MRTLLFLLFVSLTRGDKLNPAYLPPPGAISSGGGDIEAPFEVPAGKFGLKDESATRLTPGIFREGGIPPTSDGRIISSTYAPLADGRISSTYAPVSEERIIPSTYTPTFNGRLSTSTYAPASDRRVTSSSYKPNANGEIPSTYAPTSYPSTTSNYNSYSTTPRAGPYGQVFDQVTDGLSNLPNDESDYADLGRPISFSPAKTGNREDESFPNNKAINTVRYPERKIRPQEEAERNSVILNYENVIAPDGYFAYSFDTSNGIHADESGTASDGVKATGSYSYIGDDGKLYNVTYSADEYGFQPRGDHLPTPPPVPDAILKVIEQAAKDRDNGIFDDGSYDEKKYGYKNYQPLRDRILGSNDPRLDSQRRQNNGLTYKEPSDISDGNTVYKTDGSVSPSLQGENTNNGNQKGTNFIEANTSKDDQILDSPNTIRIPGNKINNYNSARDETYNKYNLPSNKNNEQNNRADGISSNKDSDKNQSANGPDFENKASQNGYNYPNPNSQFDRNIPNQSSRFENEFATGRPTKYYSPSTERVRDFGAYTEQPDEYSGGERMKQTSRRPTIFNNPTAPDRVRDFSTTYRPSDYYNHSSPTETYTDGPRDFYGPSSTESAKEFGSYTYRPNDYYSPSTGGVKIYDTATGRPSIYYGPSSDNREIFGTDRPKDLYNPSSTQGVSEQNTYRLSDYYNTSPIQPIQRKELGTSYTERPNKYYSPISTEKIRPTGSFTRLNDYNGPTSAEGIKETGTYSVRPTGYSYDRPSTSEKINGFNTATGKPSDYYNPASTEKVRLIGSSTRPGDYYRPTSSERINDFGTATGRPSDYYSPSSTERIKDFGTVTGRPSDYYVPSSTERIKDFGTATGRPSDYYGPSSTERIKDFGTVTGRPTDFYRPSSTERIKDFGTVTGRPSDYYSPSSTERIKDYETATGRPIEYYNPSSTERIIGEDFRGPKQPQTYDPKTGYHY